ncbi:hypothetical protein BVG19_g4154 [[Candida] boidinii]|nr:hypothetical protein BVG19_g4154 [[Candida] boidinii]OWB53547.1 hypothetical protein B5S27_g5149 [[Candida] boidinii]
MFRLAINTATKRSSVLTTNTSRIICKINTTNSIKFYSTENNGNGNSNIPEGEERFYDILNKIKQSPEVIEQMRSLQDLIIEKKLLPPPGEDGKPEKLSLMQQVKVLMDADVRSRLGQLGQSIKDAGIEIKKEDVKLLLDLLKNKMN